MNPLEHLSGLRSAQWPSLRRSALADGRDCVLDPECEHAAAVEDLVALTVPELPSLGVFAMLAECRPEPCVECARALSFRAACVLRLVDRALAAHGRDHGYPVTAWLERAFEHAQGYALGAAELTSEEAPASTLVAVAADALGDVVMALYGDPLGVPEGLADALGSLLALYAAGEEPEA
jgi:hypothetical protein